MPLIADGGIRYSGDIAKAIVAGAHCVMIGGLFAGTEESPGEVELYQGRSYKAYRGMGSVGAMGSRTARPIATFRMRPKNWRSSFRKVSKAALPTRAAWLPSCISLIGGIRAAMGYTGSASIDEMRVKPTVRTHDGRRHGGKPRARCDDHQRSA